MLTENLQIYIDTKELAKLLLTYQPNVPRIARYGEYGKMVAMARTWLCGNLRLTLHPRKVCVQQVRRGMRFTGMFVKNGLILPSRRLIEGAYRLARGSRGMSREKVAGRMNSRFGLMVHCRSYMLRRRLWRVLAANDNGRFICINHKKLKERKLKNETIHESERTY